MIDTMKTFFRRAAYTGLGFAALSAVGPFAFESWHNSNQSDKTSKALEKMTQEKLSLCDATAAGVYQNGRAEKILAAAKTAFVAPASTVTDTYISGVKRIANATVPGLVLVAKQQVSYLSDISSEYYKGSYETDADRLANYTASLARLGIGICFDDNLGKITAGSAYVRERGLVTLNPVLTAESMSAHLRRHLLRLEQEVVTPYDKTVIAAGTLSSAFETRFDAVDSMAALRHKNPVVLPLHENADLAEFSELNAGVYKAPLPEFSAPAPLKK